MNDQAEIRKHLKWAWQGMKARCYPKTYHRELRWWAGKGIGVCAEWLLDFESFYEWAIESGYQIGLCLDRIDADGDYEPSNCQWLTRVENTLKACRQRQLNKTKYGQGGSMTPP